MTPTVNTSTPTPSLDWSEEKLASLATGRRLVHQCLLLELLSSAYGVENTALAGSVVIVTLCLTLAGVVQLVAALSLRRSLTIALAVAVFVPVTNILALAWLGIRAGDILRMQGYRVGLIVATPPPRSFDA